jgi:hypothetical protein
MWAELEVDEAAVDPGSREMKSSKTSTVSVGVLAEEELLRCL